MATIKVKKNNEWHSVAIGKTEIIEVPAEPVIEAIEIVENGTFTAPIGVDGYSPITVNVPTGGGGDSLPDEAFTITGTCNQRFTNNYWNWFIENYGNKIITNDITNANEMFNNCSQLTNIPFNINFNPSQAVETQSMFYGCSALMELPTITNLNICMANYMFGSCAMLREIPDNFLENISYDYKDSGGAMYNIFTNCYSLRTLPMALINGLNKADTSEWDTYLANGFEMCYSLDEAVNLPVSNGIEWTSDAMYSTVNCCTRLKNLTFEVNDDGTPKTVRWAGQNLNLANNVGYCNFWHVQNILSYNSGITADKEVKDDATYQALKNDPDWFSQKIEYSRYNHDSAVATINSLPDTSAFVDEIGMPNTIIFKSEAGSLTDGGAINTLTEAEIAVAAAKGWTVTFE